MWLFLSSENFGNHSNVLAELAKDAGSVLYIGNAKDYISTEERAAKIAQHKQQFVELGFRFTELDLGEYFDGNLPKNILDGFGLVWCSGGNSFLLRAAMKLSGFDSLLKEKVSANAVAYGGSSAGSIIMGPTLRGTEHGDNPEAVKDVYRSNIVWDGLGLVNFVVIPHWNSESHGDDAKRMRRALELDEQKTPFKKLQDGQVFLLDGDKEELLQ